MPRSIEDQELLFDENGLSDDRTDSARTHEPGERSDDMNEKDDEIAHLSILARTAIPQELWVNQQFAIDRNRFVFKSLFSKDGMEFLYSIFARTAVSFAIAVSPRLALARRFEWLILTNHAAGWASRLHGSAFDSTTWGSAAPFDHLSIRALAGWRRETIS